MCRSRASLEVCTYVRGNTIARVNRGLSTTQPWYQVIPYRPWLAKRLQRLLTTEIKHRALFILAPETDKKD